MYISFHLYMKLIWDMLRKMLSINLIYKWFFTISIGMISAITQRHPHTFNINFPFIYLQFHLFHLWMCIGLDMLAYFKYNLLREEVELPTYDGLQMISISNHCNETSVRNNSLLWSVIILIHTLRMICSKKVMFLNHRGNFYFF